MSFYVFAFGSFLIGASIFAAGAGILFGAMGYSLWLEVRQARVIKGGEA